MADDGPRVALGLDAAGKPVVLLGTQGASASDMRTLLAMAPGLASPAHAADLARAANHLAHGGEFRVITDPAAFEEAYRTRLSHEDPNEPFREGSTRLHDYGVPDFRSITAPHLEGGTLTFFAADMYSGVPYRAETSDLSLAPEYHVVPLTPLPTPPRPPPKPDALPDGEPGIAPLTPEERASRRTVMPGDVPPP